VIIHNIFSVNDFEEHNIFDNSIAIMIDVLRASTTVCTALNNGAKSILPCESYEKAGRYFVALNGKQPLLLGGERNTEKPENYNLGNSPAEYSREIVEGKTIILATTNGTKIFEKGKTAFSRIVGCFVNEKAVINFVLEKILEAENWYNQQLQEENSEEKSLIEKPKIVTVCAGTGGRISIEDVLCAGNFIHKISSEIEKINENKKITFTDGAIIAKDFYLHNQNKINDLILNCDHSARLKKKGMEQDIFAALDKNSVQIVPIINPDGYIKLKN
jgi:2-phosphosulfolactate phosphatase